MNVRLVALAVCAALGSGCAGKPPAPPKSPTERAREDGPSSTDGEVVGRWLLGELIAPGGTPQGAEKARKRLEEIGGKGMYASMARGLDDASHGRLKAAAVGYSDTVRAAKLSGDPLAPSIGWYAVNHLLTLDSSVPSLWRDVKPFVLETLDNPGSLGWRGRGELVEWWSKHAFEDAEADLLDHTAKRYGCATKMRLAGPFGHAASADRWRSFPAERPGPWPASWAPDPQRAQAPRVLKTERHGCTVRTDEPVNAGIFYAETFVDTTATRDVIIAVQSSFDVWVDDQKVLTRDVRQWGVWPKFGAYVRLEAGHHRLLARVSEPETSIRILRPDGTPADVTTGVANGATYPEEKIVTVGDPNAIDRYLPNGTAHPPVDPLEDFIAAYLAALEGQYDVASVMMEPLISDQDRASPVSLSTAASFAEKDPIFPESDAHDLGRILREKAVEKDSKLYFPRVWLVVDKSDKGMPQATLDVHAMAAEFPEAPEVLRVLGSLYSRLGWQAERTQTAIELVTRFPEDRGALEQAIPIYEEQGKLKEADELSAKLRALYPDSEIELDRALGRRDYKAAIEELKRLGARRPDRKDLAERIGSLLTRSGKSSDPIPQIERILKRNPRDSSARLALADARFAKGDTSSLRFALAAAIQEGANTEELRGAIELVEGMTELEPYRIDGRKVIAEYEKDPQPLEGTAARVLDYSALWIHADGSSRMLEHELIRVQSQEAIGKLAEQRVPQGALVLRLRVIKKDGTILEPERVEGKPTVTMPHLEIGDYIETENITPQESDGEGGKRYVSPTWFFREADIAYWRSEFIVIAPKGRGMVVETTGTVAAPLEAEDGPLKVRRWRVDRSPAAPVEPSSVPVQEFLPSVRVGWGVTLEGQLERLRDATTDDLPRDPRLGRIATRIVGDVPKEDVRERARLIYRWVLANVEDGRETDGRRVIIGKSGSRAAAFLYLARSIGVPVKLGVVKDRLRPKDEGPIAEALAFGNIVIVLDVPCAAASKTTVVATAGAAGAGGASNVATADTSCTPLWFTVGEKYAPFGFLPAELRDQPAIRLEDGLPRDHTQRAGSTDGIVYDGTAELRADGSAMIDLAQRFVGHLAIGVRGTLEQLPEEQLRGVVESRLLSRALPGARLVKLVVEDKDDLDKPLTLRMTVEVSDFARKRGHVLALKPPLMLKVAGITALETRQTPMLLPDATHSEVHLKIVLPQGAKVLPAPGTKNETLRDGDRTFTSNDSTADGSLQLERILDIPAGRVSVAEYAPFRVFTQQVDDTTSREVLIELAP